MVTCQHLLSSAQHLTSHTVSFAVYVAALLHGHRGKPSAALSPSALDGELPQTLPVVLVMSKDTLKNMKVGTG